MYATTVDIIEGAHLLVIQTANILCFHLRAARLGAVYIYRAAKIKYSSVNAVISCIAPST